MRGKMKNVMFKRRKNYEKKTFEIKIYWHQWIEVFNFEKELKENKKKEKRMRMYNLGGKEEKWGEVNENEENFVSREKTKMKEKQNWSQ